MDFDALLAPDTLLGRVARWLREEGVEAYLVGGSVRDALMGHAAHRFHDLDFAVPMGGLAVARRLANQLGGAFFPLDTERDTGRVVLTQSDGGRLYLDIARWRGNSLHTDLADRDFTINAMALDITQRTGASLIDPFDGQADLSARVVRAVTEQSFSHDPVRTLRAARMEAELGFRIEPHTETLLRQGIPWLDRISRERVRDELDRIVASPGAAGHVRRLDDLGLLAAILPEVEALKGMAPSPPHRTDIFAHTLKVLEALEGLFSWLWPDERYTPLAGTVKSAMDRLSPWHDDLRKHLSISTSGDRMRRTLLKLAALFHDTGKPATRSANESGRIRYVGHEMRGAEIAARTLRRLRYSGEEVSLAQTIVAHHRRPFHPSPTEAVTRRSVYRFFRDAGTAGVDAIFLSQAEYLAMHRDSLDPADWQRRADVTAALLEGYFDRREDIVSPPKLISGWDLMTELRLPPGPRVGELLERVREAQAEGAVSTPEEALALVRELLKAQPHPS